MTGESIREGEILFDGKTFQRVTGLARQLRAGGRPKKLTAAEIEAEISALAREKAALVAGLEATEARRTEAVLAGVPFAEIREIEAEREEKNYLLEQLEAAEEPLRQRLSEAVSEARRAEWKRRAAELQRAAEVYLQTAKNADLTGREFLKLREEVGATFGEISLLMPLPVLPGGAFLVDRALLENWHFEAERFFGDLPEIDAKRGKPWDGAGDRELHLDYTRRRDEPQAIFGRPEPPAPEPPARRERRSHAPSTLPAEPKGDGKIVTKPRLGTMELIPEEDGKVPFYLVRRFEPAGGGAFEAGNCRLTPGEAMAAMNAGAGDLAPAPIKLGGGEV